VCCKRFTDGIVASPVQDRDIHSAKAYFRTERGLCRVVLKPMAKWREFRAAAAGPHHRPNT
jgi:hypothetical protein